MEKTRNKIIIFVVLSIVGGVFLAAIGLATIVAVIVIKNPFANQIDQAQVVQVQKKPAADPNEKVTQANFDKLRQGQPYQEVKNILGAETEKPPALGPELQVTSGIWKSKDGTCTIGVAFVRGRLDSKNIGFEEWVDPDAEKVTRANYNKILPGFELKGTQRILGPGREDARFGQSLNMSWRSKNGGCIIPPRFALHLMMVDSPAGF